MQGAIEAAAPPPVLHLSGPKLRAALETLIDAAEPVGGVERLAAAVKLKGAACRERLDRGRAASLSRARFEELVALMPTVRRRWVGLLAAHGWARVREVIAELLERATGADGVDVSLARFERALATSGPDFPSRAGQGTSKGERSQRFLRDLAAELLHGADAERFPLMTRWIWDQRANTGVLREIWHDPATGDDVDGRIIDIADGYETFIALRSELSQFLAEQGIFRDMLAYVDLLQGKIYAGYIDAQGGALLKTEFSSEADPLEHTLRILGLDRKQAIGNRQWAIGNGW